MNKGKIFALVGMAVLGGLLYIGIQSQVFAQTATNASQGHIDCLPTKDYANSNGYVESYTRPNTCHSKKVFFYYGPYYRNSNNWRVRCPSGATMYVHSRAHYMMSPTLDGEYDGGAGGGAHYFCGNSVNPNENPVQVDPVPGESEANPFHTHVFDGLAKVDVVDSDTDYYYSFKLYQWVSCPGSYQGPFQNTAPSTDTQYGYFNNHFHCKNPTYAAGSTSDNPEAAPMALTAPPSSSFVGSFSISDTGTKDQFVDKGPWGATAPLGTVSCVHTNSDKVYFSTTGTCPAASQFPLKPTYTFALTKVDATLEAKIGAPAWIKFKLQNTSTAQIDFPIYCDAGNGSFLGNMYYLNADGTMGEKFVNPGAYSNPTSAPSANAVIPAGTEKSFQFKFDIPASVAVTGTWTGKCHTYPKDNSTGNLLTDKKQEITNALIVTATPDSPAAVSATALTQYGTNKYSIKVEDADGLKEFSVKTVWTAVNPTGRSMYSGSPGAAGNVGACSGTNPFKTLDSGTVTIESNEWPLNFTVTDCKANVKIGNVSPPGGLPPPPTPVPGAGAPEPTNDESGVWAQVEISTGKIVNSAICTRSVCGLNGEWHGYVPPPTYPTGSVWWPTSKRYIWQIPGQAGYSSGTFDFNTYIFTVPGGTIYNGKFTSTTTPPPPPNPNLVQHTWNFSDSMLTSSIFNRTDKEYTDFIASVDAACKLISKTKFTWKSGSGDDSATNWRNFGIPDCSGTTMPPPPPDDHAGCDMKMYYLKNGQYVDESGAVGPTAATYRSSADHYHICSTTTPPPPPPPDDTKPRACKPGYECPKGSWCESGGQQCYSPDSKLTCVPSVTPTSVMPTTPYGGSNVRCLPGTQPCRPEDMTGIGSRCANPGLDNRVKYFPSGSTSGGINYWCGGGTQPLYSKTKNTDGSYYMICLYSDETRPSGYQDCRPEDNGCKQKPDQWTAEDEKGQMGSGSFYCMNSQKCTLKSGGGKCVGWNDSCGENAVYCPQYTPPISGAGGYISKCGEPETFTDIDASAGQSFWCGGGGMAFYSKTKAYCPQKKVSGPPDYGMFTGAEIKAILEKLGPGFGLCNPYSNTGSATYSSKCLNPGEKGSSSDWCAWNPPGSMMTMTPMISSTRTCPALDAVVTPPPPPADDEKHRGCSMTMYIKNEKGLMVDKETGVPAPIPASKKGYITDFKWVDDHYHLCDTPIGEPPPPPPPDFRECRPGEIPSATNVCMLPSYRWVIADKKWEKCPFAPPNPLIMAAAPFKYIDLINDPNAKTTNCQSMNFEIEEPWKTLRYLTRPPEKFGEWYMPPWDASALTKQYDPKTDRFEECKKMPYLSPLAESRNAPWYAPCTSVPETDEKWLLAMYRAQYKLYQLYNQNRPFPPGPLPPDVPLPPEPPKPEQPIPDIPIKQCKQYLIGIKNGLNGDKQFWKEVKRQTAVLPPDHPDIAAINKLLDDAKKLIQDIEGVTRLGRCEKEPLTKVKELTEKLHNEIFAELSSYLGAVHDYIEVGFCTTKLQEGAKRLRELVEKADDDIKTELTEFAGEIEGKISEFNKKTDDFEFDMVFECREYLNKAEPRIATLMREGDHEVREIVERVITKELQPLIEQLKEESAARKERIETLLVQVAQLQQSVAELKGAAQDLTKRAEEMTNQVAVSLKQISYLEEKFEKERTEIEESKSKLVSLVGRLIDLMGEKSCLRGADQAQAFRVFERATSVNWIGDRADELERRFNGWMTACERKELTREDIERLALALDDAARLNQKDSFEKKMTCFEDVATHEWFFGGMQTGCRTNFITQGRPGDQVLRQDALLMIFRMKGLTDAELKGDCEIPRESSVINASPYARCAVVQALKRGLIVRGNVSVPVSRGEIASWIAALELVPEISKDREVEIKASYKDLRVGVLPEWVSAIARLVDAKVMVGQVGTEVSIWQPFENLTRASLAVVLEQLQK